MEIMGIIWKYELTIDEEQVLRIPVGADLLTVDVQMGVPCLWALVPDPSADYEERRILTWMTGQAGARGTYIGTYQIISSMSGGPGRLVCHVFEDDGASGA